MRSCLLDALLSTPACGGPKPGHEVTSTPPATDGARACHDAHDCTAGEACFAPDFAPHGRSACCPP
jgi:hypothetical protein